MSEQEKNENRLRLLGEFDAQKTLVANLRERDNRDREAFREFSAFLSSCDNGSVDGETLYFGDGHCAATILDARAAIGRRTEFLAASKRLSELHERCKAIGISLS